MDHIVAHSIMVSNVTRFICSCLKKTAPDSKIDARLAANAALLHDITKTRSFETGEDHAATGRELLAERGFPKVARIVGQHVHLYDAPREERVDEAQIVNYADKRVLHDEIVSLEKRMAYIVERYGQEEAHRKRIMMLWEESRGLEERIFRHVDFAPDELTAYISTE